MSLTNASTKSISDALIAQMQASLNQSIPLLPKSFSRVLAKVMAGVFVLLYKYGGFIFLQLFVTTATNKPTVVNGVTIRPLTFWGRLFGVGDATAATQAELNIDVTVNTQSGVLSAGTKLVGVSNGVTYSLLADVALDAPTVRGLVRAVSDPSLNGGRGVIGNLDVGAELSFASPPANISGSATVASQAVTAADAETDEAYRQRILDRVQKRPQGGAYADYEQWGEEVAGIINVYPYTGDPGQVNVYSEATVASSGSADGIPTQAQLDAVFDSIELDQSGLASRRPAGSFVNSLPITRTSFDVRIVGITGVNNLSQVKADIEAALTDYFKNSEPFIHGLSIPPRKDDLTRTRVSATIEDIVTADGGTFSLAEFFPTSGSGSLTVYRLGEGEKAKLGSVSYL